MRAMGYLTLARTPSAHDIPSGVESTLRKEDPAQIRFVRKTPEGRGLEDTIITVSCGPEPDAATNLPRPLMITGGISVNLNILDSTVFYILENRGKSLRISRTGILPFKMEHLSEKRNGTVYQSAELVQFSDMVRHYPGKKVWRGGEPVLQKRLLPATAAITGQ